MQTGALSEEAVRLVGMTRQPAESDRLRLVDQVVEPILSIVRELLGCAIGGILLEQSRESAKRTIANGMSVGEAAIDLRQPLGNQRHAEAIHHDMMVARIPEKPISRRLEQGVSEQRTACRINRPCQVGLHPGFGGDVRVGLGTDVDDRHRPRGGSVDDLPRPLRVLDEPDPQCLGFGYNLSQCPLK